MSNWIIIAAKAMDNIESLSFAFELNKPLTADKKLGIAMGKLTSRKVWGKDGSLPSILKTD